MKMKKIGLLLMVMAMLLTFAASASASSTRTDTGTRTHSGGNLLFEYTAYDSHVHGWMYGAVYRVTPTGDVLISTSNIEGGMPYDSGFRTGKIYLTNLPAGTYKYVVTLPSAWMGPSISWSIF